MHFVSKHLYFIFKTKKKLNKHTNFKLIDQKPGRKGGGIVLKFN